MTLKRKVTQVLSAACVMGALSGQAYGLEIWHSNTVWAGQGMCAASFTLDSGGAFGDRIQNLRIASWSRPRNKQPRYANGFRCGRLWR